MDSKAQPLQGDAPMFDLPVDSEHKATRIKIWSFCRPHMSAFHLSWVAFFLAFVSTFGPAALMTVVRDNLNMNKFTLGDAGICSVTGGLVSRIFMGNVVDTLGPKLGIAATMWLTAVPVFCIGFVTDAGGLMAARFFIGFSLSTFVGCQFWVGSMFTTKIVGTANAIAAGWGNMGGGATHWIMPLTYEGIARYLPAFQAWRWSFFVPGGCQLIAGLLIVLLGQDLPDGDYATLKNKGQMARGQGWATFKTAVSNYRTWILSLTYGYCFGVELTVDNTIVSYLYDQFNLNLTVAGALGAVFGFMNLWTRASGGYLSDVSARYFGMRGRLWVLYIIQTLGGVFCIAMAYCDYTLTGTIVNMVIFSIFCQQACGATFGIAPFVSRRSYGMVSGIVGAGGNVGAIVTTAMYFGGRMAPDMTTPEGYRWMGVMILVLTMPLFLVYFPMWGGMLFPAKPGVTEEDYYLSEYSAEERANGMHSRSLKFAFESRSERGWSNLLKDQGMTSSKRFDESITTEPELPSPKSTVEATTELPPRVVSGNVV